MLVIALIISPFPAFVVFENRARAFERENKKVCFEVLHKNMEAGIFIENPKECDYMNTGSIMGNYFNHIVYLGEP